MMFIFHGCYTLILLKSKEHLLEVLIRLKNRVLDQIPILRGPLHDSKFHLFSICVLGKSSKNVTLVTFRWEGSDTDICHILKTTSHFWTTKYGIFESENWILGQSLDPQKSIFGPIFWWKNYPKILFLEQKKSPLELEFFNTIMI